MQCFARRNRLPALPILMLSILAGTPAAAQSPPLMPDWVPRDALDAEQLEGLHPACCGRFVEPLRDDPLADLSPEVAPTQIDAPQGLYQSGPDQLLIRGPLQLLQGYRSLSASDQAELNETTGTLRLDGDVRFREPGILLTGETAQVDEENQRSTLQQAGYVLYDTQMHGFADSLAYDGAVGYITIDNGYFSRCEPGAPFWAVQARQIDLDIEAGRGYAQAVTLRMLDTPVFYYPFTVPFPITDERMSGLLAPSISNSRRGGVDVALPYYLNLAPHYDATITPRLIARRGAMLAGEFRYLADWSMNTLDLTWLPDDQRYNAIEAQIPGSDSPPGRHRWFVGVDHEGVLNEQWSTQIDFNAVSDVDYFRDLGSRGLSLDNRSHLNREARLRYRDARWQASAGLQRIEIIDPFLFEDDINKPYDRLPELQLGLRQPLGPVEFDLGSNYTRFDRQLQPRRLSQAQIDNGALATGQRLTLSPSVSLPLRRPGMFIVPTLRQHHVRWQLDDAALGSADSAQISVPVASIDAGLIFERSLQLGGEGFLQTLEPRLYYLYAGYEDQSQLPLFDTSQQRYSMAQLFRDNRFNGGDRFGDANQLSIALSSRLYDNRGREQAAFGIGQIHHFRDRRVSPDSPLQQWLQYQPISASRSPLIMEGHLALGERWSGSADLHWNESGGSIEETSLSLRWRGDAQQLLNLAYRYRALGDAFPQSPGGLERRVRQTDISTMWPVNDNWRLFGRWHYDHSNRRNLETFAGVEYSNCCATLRVMARDWVNDYQFLNARARQNRGIYFQLSLHGLGDLTGSGISNLLSDGIPGFREHLFND